MKDIKIEKQEYHLNKKNKDGTKNLNYYCVPRYIGNGRCAGYRYYKKEEVNNNV